MLDVCLDRKSCVIYGQTTNQFKDNCTELQCFESHARELLIISVHMAVAWQLAPQSKEQRKIPLDGLRPLTGFLMTPVSNTERWSKYKQRQEGRFITLETKEK